MAPQCQHSSTISNQSGSPQHTRAARRGIHRGASAACWAGSVMLARRLAVATVLLLAIAAALPAARAETLATDKAALLAFKAAITADEGLLQSWTNTTDPCDTPWRGINCTCVATSPFDNCTVPAAGQPQRVLQLDFDLPNTATAPQLTGSVPAGFAGLTALRRWSLPRMNLVATLPNALVGLQNLEQLELQDNKLSGSLPGWAGNLTWGQEVRFDDNMFTGPIPASWCPSTPPVQTYPVTLSGNQGLCDTVPTCMESRLPSTSGTGLISAGNSFGSTGKLCNATEAPLCNPSTGCGIVISPYNTRVSSIFFSFTPFAPGNTSDHRTENGVNYFWGLGTIKGQDNVLTLNPVDTNDNFTGTVSTSTGANVTRLLYGVSQNLSGVAFINGQVYYPVVTASSQFDPSLITNLTGPSTLTDTDPPFLPPNGVIDNTEDYQVVQSQTDTDQMGVSWDDWKDPQSGVKGYAYQILMVSDAAGRGVVTTFTNASAMVNVGLNTSGLATGLNLQPGKRYAVRCTATNNAGLSAYADSPALVISSANGVSTSSAAIIAAACIGVCSIIVALITVFVVRSRYNARRASRREQRRQMKELKALMYGLVSSGGDPLQKRMDEIRNSRQLCFVMTDLEASTAQAAADPDAFLQVQDIHDTVMREGIAKHGGYEINTEGDAFQVAFTSVQQAVLFCMETQYRLLESAWTTEVLKLPSCKEVVAADGSLLFRGPRVRMGIHWAGEGTVAHRLHLLTKHRVFSGPGFLVTQEIGDAAHGGQVALSHDAWLELRNNMDQAGFPTVEQLGLFKLNSWPAPIWLYQVTHLLGKPLLRVFGQMRRILQIEPGWGLNIVPPPIPRSQQGPLTFVAVRAALDELGLESAPGSPPLELPASVSRKLYEVIAITAMQFRGYIFKVNESHGRFMLAFASTLDAVRCCHAAQAHLLFTSWPTEAIVFSGATEHMPDGRLVFRGLRLATAIHETIEYSVAEVAPGELDGKAQHRPVEYSGPGETFVRYIANATYGGQVVLTEPAWTTVQDHIPGQAQVVSLGIHVIEVGAEAYRMLLMEVMPSVLARRTFPPPRTAAQLEPGFRDAPDPAHHLAILFMKASKPKEVTAAEQAAGSVADELVISTITDYNLAVAMVSRLVRQLLPAYDGYECKEPEAAKFTLAFRSLEAGVRWAAAMQTELLQLPWPEAVLAWGACAEERDAGGRLVWRGLRVRMGLAWGGATYRKPLNTGRADYFGTIPNLAARVSALAAPGQVLLEGTGLGLDDMAPTSREDSAVLLPPLEGGPAQDDGLNSVRGLFSPTRPPVRDLSDYADASDRHDSRYGCTVHLKCLGQFMLKGLSEPKVIWQALPARLAQHREFLLPPEHMALRVESLTARRAVKGATGVSPSKASFGSSDDGGLPRGISDVPRSVLELVGLKQKRSTGTINSCDADSPGVWVAGRSTSLTGRQDSNPSARDGRANGFATRSCSGSRLHHSPSANSTTSPLERSLTSGTVERTPSWIEEGPQPARSNSRAAAHSRSSYTEAGGLAREPSKRSALTAGFSRRNSQTAHGSKSGACRHDNPFAAAAAVHRSARSGSSTPLGSSPPAGNGVWAPQPSGGSADLLQRANSSGSTPGDYIDQRDTLADYGSSGSMPLFVRNGVGTETVLSRSHGDLPGMHLASKASGPRASGGSSASQPGLATSPFARGSGSAHNGCASPLAPPQGQHQQRERQPSDAARGSSSSSGDVAAAATDANMPQRSVVGFSHQQQGSGGSAPSESDAAGRVQRGSQTPFRWDSDAARFGTTSMGYAREVAELFLGRPSRASLEQGARRTSGSGHDGSQYSGGHRASISPQRSHASVEELDADERDAAAAAVPPQPGTRGRSVPRSGRRSSSSSPHGGEGRPRTGSGSARNLHRRSSSDSEAG